jgi:hypothetical protein
LLWDYLVIWALTLRALQVCGRKIVRRLVQLAGLPCFWDGQYTPPPSLLTRAKDYVGILASIMEVPQSAGTIELLQGEPIALLLKSIGNALAKPDPGTPGAPGASGTSGYPGVRATSLAGGGMGQQQKQQGPGRQQQQGKVLGGQGPCGGAEGVQLSGLGAEKLQSLRALVVLMYLLGEHLGTHALQVGLVGPAFGVASSLWCASIVNIFAGHQAPLAWACTSGSTI